MINSFEQLREELKVVENECKWLSLSPERFEMSSLRFFRKMEGSNEITEKRRSFKGKALEEAIPAFLECFGDYSNVEEVQQIAKLWREMQRVSLCFKRRDEILKALHSLQPLNLKSPFVTFLLCIQRTGLSKALRNLIPKIYSFYIASEMNGFELKRCGALERVSKGGKWLIDGSLWYGVETLMCLDTVCIGRVGLSDCYVKSKYFEWLDAHFVKEHGFTWKEHFQKALVCDHDLTNSKIENYNCQIFYCETCNKCGKLLKRDKKK